MHRATNLASFFTLFALAAAAATACGPANQSGTGATPTPTSGGAPRYHEDVQPVLAENCVGCHTAGGIAPFALDSYDLAKANAVAIKSAVASRIMPPFMPDNSGSCNTWSNARTLTDTQIAMLGAWADSLTPEGNPSIVPAPTPTPLTLDHVDLVADMGVWYTPDGTKSDDYHCFVIDPGLATDQYLTAFRTNPGSPGEVHHMILFQTVDASGDAEAAANDAADPTDGYSCFGGTNVTKSEMIAAWVPGSSVNRFPDGTGVKLKAGRSLIMQIHYNELTEDVPDRTTLDLETAPTVAKEGKMTLFADGTFTLPPGEEDTVVTKDFTIPSNATVYGVASHMHVLGKSETIDIVHAGATSCMQEVPRWDFHWQGIAYLNTPVSITAGDTVRITCHYNTTSQTSPVSQGEDTTQEMCLGGFFATIP